MNNPIFSVKLPYRVRCNLPDCQKPVNLVFKKSIEGNMNTFCSPYHANLGEERWEEKKKLNIQPGRPLPPDITEEYVGGNTEDLMEGGE